MPALCETAKIQQKYTWKEFSSYLEMIEEDRESMKRAVVDTISTTESI